MPHMSDKMFIQMHFLFRTILTVGTFEHFESTVHEKMPLQMPFTLELVPAMLASERSLVRMLQHVLSQVSVLVAAVVAQIAPVLQLAYVVQQVLSQHFGRLSGELAVRAGVERLLVS